MLRLARISRVIKPKVVRPSLPCFQSFRAFSTPTCIVSSALRTNNFLPKRYQHSVTQTDDYYEDNFCTLELEGFGWSGATRTGFELYIQNCEKEDLQAVISRIKTIYNNLEKLDLLAKQFLLENETETIANWTENEENDITMDWLNKEFKLTGIDFDAKDQTNETFLIIYTQKDIDETGHSTDVEFEKGAPVRFRLEG